MAKKKNRIPDFGIELMYGEPGAGKSFMAVQRSIRVMLEQRRPVYTNLPLRWRVFKTYLRLRGGEQLAALLRPLSEDHFNRFTARAEAARQWKEQAKLGHPDWKRKRLHVEWQKHAGPDIVDGDEANWLPAYAVIVIDEAHHWYPNPALKNVRKVEPPSLMSYLTMHRHHLHWVWILTQADRQISSTFKSLVQRVWDIRNRAFDQVAWSLQFRHLGIKALGYRAFRPEDDVEVDQPVEQFTVFPWLPWNQIYFRLYDSMTHVGSRRQLREGLKAVRRASGLDDRGRVDSEVEAVAKKPGIIGRTFRAGVKLAVMSAVLLMVLAVGVYAGKSRAADDVKVEVEKVKADAAAKVEAVKTGGREHAASMPAVRLVSIAPGRVRLSDGQQVQLGGRCYGLVLSACDPGSGASIWADGVDAWVWRVGGQPERLGPIRETVAAAERFGASKRVGAPGRPGPSASQPAVVP